MSARGSIESHRSRILFAAILIATLLLLHARAGGQPVDNDPARGPYDDRGEVAAVDWTLASGETLHERAPALAAGLSAGATFGGGLVLAVGVADEQPGLAIGGALAFAVGPSLGHWYSGRAWTPSLATRIGSAVVSGAGLMVVLGCTDGETGDACELGGEAALLGTAAYVASAAYEIVTAPQTARARGPRDTRLVIAPMRGQQHAVPGLALATRF